MLDTMSCSITFSRDNYHYLCSRLRVRLIAQKDVDDLLSSQGDINNFLERKKSVVEITSNQDNE